MVVCTSDIYHSTFDWPSSASVAARLEKAAGTSEEEMVCRLVTHHRNIAGIRSCYEHVLKVINADQPKADVFSQGILSPSALQPCLKTVSVHLTVTLQSECLYDQK